MAAEDNDKVLSSSSKLATYNMILQVSPQPLVYNHFNVCFCTTASPNESKYSTIRAV